MSNSAKSRFAGFLRGLLHRKDDPGETLPVSAPRPVATAAHTPVAAPVEYAPAPAAATATPAVDEISLPLAPVIATLPMELRGKIMSVPSPGMTFKLPVETITSQLAFGAVKITFGELRQLAPGIFSNSGGDLDCRPINLPLHEILPRLSPSMLSRRTAPKVEVSEEIFFDEMVDLMRQIMRGEVSPVMTAALLTGLRVKKETIGEIAAAASVMREFSAKVEVADNSHFVDIVGTGGDGAPAQGFESCHRGAWQCVHACAPRHRLSGRRHPRARASARDRRVWSERSSASAPGAC